MQWWWCRIRHHPRRKGRVRDNRSKGRTSEHPQRWLNNKGGGSISRDWSDRRSDGSGENTQEVGQGTECIIAYCDKRGDRGRIGKCVE